MSNRKKSKLNASEQHPTPVLPAISGKTEWANPLNIALIAYYLVMALAGVLIPDDIFKVAPWTKDFSDFMASIVPQIDRITALNIKPDVNRFYFSVLWLCSPMLFFLCLQLIWQGRFSANARMWSLPLNLAVGGMFFLFAVMAAAQFGYWMTDTTLRPLRMLLSSSLGRGFTGSLVYVHCTSMFAAMFVLWLFGWLTGYIPQNIKRQSNV